MNIKCERDRLLENISLVSKAVSSRTTLPILECFLLKCDEAGFWMFSTDQEIAVKTGAIECEIIEQGAVALPSRFFSEIVRKLPIGTVSITVAEKYVTSIKCGNSEFKIIGANPEDFPEIEEIQRDNKYVINQGIFKNLIKRTAFSICQDTTKPNLMGAYIEIAGGALNMVTCDAYRVSFASGELPEGNAANGVIVPHKTVTELQRLLSDDDNMSVFISDKHILFDIGSCIVFSRLIEGEFINYSSIFPDDFKTTVTVDRSLFGDALERAALVSYYENRKNPVRIKIAENMLTITTSSETGNLFEEIDVDLFGDELEIAFNPRFMIDAVKAVEENEVKVEFNASLSPCVLKPVAENAPCKYLVLPLRLKN